MDKEKLRSAAAATGLPLVPHLDGIAALYSRRGPEGAVAVLRADPGSGKSTLVPLALASVLPGRILMLEPRRVAAAGVASRMADLLGEEVGGFVGYAVRQERRVGRDTRIEVVTEGLLTRRLLGEDPLKDADLVVFDEFHERSIHADLALALLLELRLLRPELGVLVMSATLDAAALAAFLSRAAGTEVPVVDCPGKPYPVEISYKPPRPGTRPGDAAAAAAAELLSGPGGDILVFLPGRREIDDALGALSRASSGDGRRVEVLALHGGLPLSEQRGVLRARSPAELAAARRVVLATNIAQTSLTVPGVDAVVDTGLARVQRRHAASGLDRLVLENASQADCDQRAGRAGRLGPGRCVRLWTAHDGRPAETEPEILRSELSPLALDCALWGARSARELSWLDAPPEGALEDAAELLLGLGALDEAGRATPRGERMSRLGAHPRLAALVLDGAGRGLGAVAAAAASALSDRDASGIRDDADFSRRLDLLRGVGSLSGPAYAWRDRVLEGARDLLRRAGAPAPKSGAGYGAADVAEAGPLVASAFPDRLAKRQESGLYRIPAGREFKVDGPLSREEWLAVLDADAGERAGLLRLALAVADADARRLLGAAYPESRSEARRVEWEGLAPRSFACRRAGRLVLSERRVKTEADGLGAAFARLLADKGIGLLPWDGAGSPDRLLARARFWAARGGELPPLDDAALVSAAADWLGPYLRVEGGPVIDGPLLRDALRGLLGHSAASRLDSLVPESLQTPAGSRRSLDYGPDGPTLRVRIQEVFGLSDTPRILGEAVVLQLVSPAERPLQTTRDLASFWKNTYPEVRREMRGRYPRHYWPENPLEAEPTSRPKPRGT